MGKIIELMVDCSLPCFSSQLEVKNESKIIKVSRKHCTNQIDFNPGHNSISKFLYGQIKQVPCPGLFAVMFQFQNHLATVQPARDEDHKSMDPPSTLSTSRTKVGMFSGYCRVALSTSHGSSTVSTVSTVTAHTAQNSA